MFLIYLNVKGISCLAVSDDSPSFGPKLVAI
jgi:hypothetical protein